MFMREPIRRMREKKCVASAQKGENEILADEELEILFNDTNFNNAFENQRYNILIWGFRTGMRPEMIQHVQTEALVVGTAKDGVSTLCSILGNMKNLPPTMNNADLDLFQHPIRACEEKRCLKSRDQIFLNLCFHIGFVRLRHTSDN